MTWERLTKAGNKRVLRIPHSSSLTGTSPSDYLVSYPGHLLEEYYPSAEMQSVYSTAPADSSIKPWEVLCVLVSR